MTAPPRIARRGEIRRRVHDARRPHRDEQIARLQRLARPLQVPRIERVLEPDDVRDASRRRTCTGAAHGDGVIAAHDALAIAANAPEAAVQLDDVRGAGAAVHAVDVLGDDHGARLRLLHRGDHAVTGVRLAGGDGRAALVVKIPDLVGIAFERALARVVLVVVLRPDPALAAERRDAALGGEPGAGEEHDALKIGEAGAAWASVSASDGETPRCAAW